MGRKSPSKNGVSLDHPNKELLDKFAKMSLKPTSQTHLIKNKKNKKKNNKRRGTRNISPDKIAKTTSGLNKNSRVIPYAVYHFLKEAVDIMNRPGYPNNKDRMDSDELKVIEYQIYLLSVVLKDYLPLGWKYDRRHASTFIGGYHTVFYDDEGYKSVM